MTDEFGLRNDSEIRIYADDSVLRLALPEGPSIQLPKPNSGSLEALSIYVRAFQGKRPARLNNP